MTPPQARIAVLAFDKLDVEKGMEIVAPDGERRWLRHPWSVLAYQLAGSDGLRLLHAEGQDAERDSAPAENLLVELLALPARQGLATLVLIDEVLMYAREKVGLDPSWRGRLLNFFQYLTQAATKVTDAPSWPRCSPPTRARATRWAGNSRRNSTPSSAASASRACSRCSRRMWPRCCAAASSRPTRSATASASAPQVVAALKGIAALDDQTRKDRQAAEERFVQSYPFHPDLTELFYTKWTNLEGFQRTRGVLRTFALALRDAATVGRRPAGWPLTSSSAARQLRHL